MEKNLQKPYLTNYNFFGSARLLMSSLPILVDNLAAGIHKAKYKHKHDNKNCKTFGNKFKD